MLNCVRKRGEMGPHGRPRHGWEKNIKLDLKEIRCEGMD